MNSLTLAIFIATWFGIGCIGIVVWRLMIRQSLVRRRLDSTFDSGIDDEIELDYSWGWIDKKLYLAGFRSPSAKSIYITASVVTLLTGAVFIFTVQMAGLVDLAASGFSSIPGGVGEVFLPFAWLSPWLAGLMIGMIPSIIVRGRRKHRIRQIEQDLPLTLDLMATLAESGLGFDAALDRFLESLSPDRPLSEDLKLFQIDVLAGRPRVNALNRLIQRVNVPWFSIFVSAIIHAEQTGGSLAQTLRIQADDLRLRRRERALALAMAVPVKLLAPLIVCFLPGIMTAALGPIVFQIIQVLDSFLQGSLNG